MLAHSLGGMPGEAGAVFFFQLKRKKYLDGEMGCLKLTYGGENPALFLEREPEKTSAINWQVWVNPGGDFWEVGEEVQAQGGPISIIKSSDQAVINQLVNAIYDARAQGKSDFDLRNYFTEYSLGKKDRKEAFAWVGFSRSLNGSINIPGGGSLKTYINLNLSENWSMLPTWPDGNQLDGKDRNGPYMVYNYYFSGTPNYPGMLIKVYTPTDAASKLANTFIWGR